MRRQNGNDIGWLLVCTCMFLSLVSVQMLYERRGWLEETVGTARRPGSDLRFLAGVRLAGDTEIVALPARPERTPGSLTTTASTTRKIAAQAKPSDDRYDGQTKDRSWLKQ